MIPALRPNPHSKPLPSPIGTLGSVGFPSVDLGPECEGGHEARRFSPKMDYAG